MKVLIPVLSRKENDAGFLEQALHGAKEVVALLVVDSSAMTGGFGFAAGEISDGNSVMDEIKKQAGAKKKTCRTVLEWGKTLDKIKALAELNKVDKIVLVKQENHYFKELVKQLKEDFKGEIKQVKIAVPEP